jgi:hypothetical protein
VAITSLAAAIIEKAVEDFRTLESMGIIKRDNPPDMEAEAIKAARFIGWRFLGRGKSSRRKRSPDFIHKKLEPLHRFADAAKLKRAISGGRRCLTVEEPNMDCDDIESAYHFFKTREFEQMAVVCNINPDAVRERLGVK